MHRKRIITAPTPSPSEFPVICLLDAAEHRDASRPFILPRTQLFAKVPLAFREDPAEADDTLLWPEIWQSLEQARNLRYVRSSHDKREMKDILKKHKSAERKYLLQLENSRYQAMKLRCKRDHESRKKEKDAYMIREIYIHKVRRRVQRTPSVSNDESEHTVQDSIFKDVDTLDDWRQSSSEPSQLTDGLLDTATSSVVW